MTKPLKEQREKLGRELNDIARITRIRSSYLKAIEEEDFAKLPVEVYTKGYIREYAKFLEYSPDEAIEPYEAYLEELKGKRNKESDKDLSHRLIESNPQKDITEIPVAELESPSLEKPEEKETSRSKEFVQRISWAAIAVAAVVVIYWLIPHGKNVSSVKQKIEPGVQYKTPEITPHVQTEEASKEKVTQPANTTAMTNVPVTIQDKPDDKNKTAQKRKHNLNITATDKAWIQVIIDGTDKKEILLNPGEKVNYEANRSISVLVGNAAGVKLKFNGKDFENLGDKGQVVTLSFPAATPKKNDTTEQTTKPESLTPLPSNSSNL